MININNTPWEDLTSSDIQALLENDNGESFFFEFKEDATRNQSIHKEISAFANTYGGYIFLGVTDNKVISGCNTWTERRIHNVIYNGISPTPGFDVKQFLIDGNTVYVIRIDEGSMPPYITTDGKIFERISSGSMPINDSSKLTQLYAKHKDNIAKLDNKIGIEDLHSTHLPLNLYGYIDIGFEVRCMDTKSVAKHFASFDFSSVGEYLKEKCPSFSVSQVGITQLITIGELTASGGILDQYIPEASMHNFMVLMPDGSAKFRICLFGDNDGYVELDTLVFISTRFQKIYEQIFRAYLENNFVYARRYEKLTVIKQFTPYYSDNIAQILGFNLDEHIEKYGNSLVVSGTRIPFNNYEVIDRSYFSNLGQDYNIDSVLKSLFGDSFVAMGFVDVPEYVKKKIHQIRKKHEH